MKVVWCSEIKGTVLILSCNNSSVQRWNRVWDLLKFQTFLYYTRVHLSVKWYPGYCCIQFNSLAPCVYVNTCFLLLAVPQNVDFNWIVCVCVCVCACARALNFVSNWEKLLLRLSRWNWVVWRPMSCTEDSRTIECQLKTIHVWTAFNPNWWQFQWARSVTRSNRLLTVREVADECISAGMCHTTLM